MTATTQRIDSLFKERKSHGISARSILLELGLSKTALSEWNRGKSKPTIDALISLSGYFNVSVDYLLGLTDNPTLLFKEQPTAVMERPSTLPVEFTKLSQDKMFVDSAKLYNAMDVNNKKEVYGFILGLATGLGLNPQQILGRKLW